LTRRLWHEKPIDPHISGFQFQTGTRWNPGLSDEKIAEFEDVLGIQVPA